MIDFPSNPSVGQVFTVGAISWTWDGVKWVAAGTGPGVYLPLTGGTMTGDLTLRGNPTTPLMASPKQYVDAKAGTYLPLAGGALTGTLSVAGGNASIVGAASATYIGISGGASPLVSGTGTVIINGGTRPTYTFEFYNGSVRTTTIGGDGAFSTTGVASFPAGITVTGPAYLPGGSNTVCATGGPGWAGFNGGAAFGGAGNCGIIVNGGGRTIYMQEFYNVNSQLIMFGGDGSAYKPGGGSWTAPSDARIKTVESDYALGLDELLQLRPVVYRYKGNDTGEPLNEEHARTTAEGSAPYPASQHYALAKAGKPHVGLIAQEVEAIFPGTVKQIAGYIDGEPVTDLRQLDTSEFLFALINAVKTLNARVAELEVSAR